MNPPEIKIEKRPRPDGRNRLVGHQQDLRNAIKRLKPDTDESFMWPNSAEPFRAAYSIKSRIRVRKVNGNGYAVWRVK